MKANVKGDNATTYILIPTQTNSGTTPIPSAADPMHNFDTLSLVLVTTLTVAGAWKVEASNDFSGQSGLQNRQSNAGTWGDVSSLCQPALAPVVSGGSKQAVQIAPFGWGAVRVTFTPTSGSGAVSAYRVAKGTR